MNGKLYRLWYEFNRKSKIKIQTGCGESNESTTGENVSQGTVGSGLLSSLNLGQGVHDFFQGSTTEISYGNTRLEPLCFQDDVARVCNSREAAQAGCNKMEAITSLKQLEINVDKSSYILLGSKTKISEIRNMIKSNPITFMGETIKEKSDEKYLGDQIHRMVLLPL